MPKILKPAAPRPRTPLRLALFLCLVASCCYAGNKKVPPVDYTKPHDPGVERSLFAVGPTGMLGEYNAAALSHQIKVRQVAKGSPADGKMSYGDVIVGVNGVPFAKGGNIIVTVGNAIDEAEKTENGGKLKLTVWRDDNAKKRDELRQVSADAIDVTALIEVIEADDSADLLRYKSEHQLKQEAAVEWQEAFDKIPVKESTREVTLTLKVMGSYSETSPWDCPKFKKIREQAYPYLIKKINEPRGFKGWDKRVLGLALLASDNPEHVEVVKKVMHGIGDKYPTRGGPWSASYNLVFLGEYYHRTGDKNALPLLAKFAHNIASNVSPGGTGGHGWCNRLPLWKDPYGPGRVICVVGNYGELNQGPNKCFYGLTLAKQAGIKDPVLDDAIRRFAQFHTSWVDRGLCPYGFHGPVTVRESNNGKNGPLAPAFRMIGQPYKARYHALVSALQGTLGYKSGHGDGTFARLWPELGAGIAGKETVIAMMKVRRPYYTMARQHDGTFVSPAEGMGLGIGSLYDPTAMAVLHFSIPLAKLYVTGRDLPSECVATARDVKNLEERINRLDVTKLSVDEIIDRLDTFHVNTRRDLEAQLVERYKAGNREILPRVRQLLDHEDRRVREAALNVYAQCGQKAVNQIEPILLERLKDPAEIVRRAAIGAIKVAAGGRFGEAKSLQRVDIDRFLKPLVDAAFATYTDHSADHVNTYDAVVRLLHGTDNAFARDPFGQGLDPKTVYRVLERFMLMDPRYGVLAAPSKFWDRETCIRMAGPLLFDARETQINSKMFRGGTLAKARDLLKRNKFLEAAEAPTEAMALVARFPRSRRASVGKTLMAWKTSILIVSSTGIRGGYQPLAAGLGKTTIPWLQGIAVANPNSVGNAIRQIHSHPTPAGWTSLGEAATRMFFKEVDAIEGKDAQVAYCRSVLDPGSKRFFQMRGAMTRLVEHLGADAIPDLAPFLAHEEWRLSDQCQDLVRRMKEPGTAEALVRLTASKDYSVAAMALRVLGQRGDRAGAIAGLKLISTHEDPWVRGAAAQAIYGGAQGSNKALVKLLLLMKGLTEQAEIDGYERALLMGVSDPTKAQVIATGSRKIMSASSIPVRRSLYYVIGQIGGAENLQYLRGQLAALKRLDLKEDRDKQTANEFAPIVDAISRSPNVGATQVCLQILKEHKGTSRAGVVSGLIFKRMINGGEVVGIVPDDVNLDFAEAHLKSCRNSDVLAYLGNIPTRRSIDLLLKNMKLGPQKVTETCAVSIERAARGITPDMPANDRKQVADALNQVLEYIMQVKLGGSRAIGEDDWYKQMWMGRADSVGQSLRRIYNPEDMIRQVPTGGGGGGGGPDADDEEDIDI